MTTFILVSQIIVLSIASSLVLPWSPLGLLAPKTHNNIYLSTSSWSKATVISDDSTLWNDGGSYSPSLAVDNNGNVHVVWYDYTSGEWGNDVEIMYANNTGSGWSNATVISDDGTLWNDGGSYSPSLAVDSAGNIHVVWADDTNGEWGNDREIMYANNTGSGWSNATVISDDSTLWNTGNNFNPRITVDSTGNIHAVWEDETNGEWGTDREIMYANNTGSGWSNATVISDDSTLWNNDSSTFPSLAVDSAGNIHVAWTDETNGTWGIDSEIMYANNTGSGWSNATVISDDSTFWNYGGSYSPSIAVDNNGNIHIVWYDYTDGAWGVDVEIMYANNTGSGWSNATVISDDSTLWNDGVSMYPNIAVDSAGNIHVVWEDDTAGVWGSDREIMYVANTGSGWSNATVISDDSTLWNDDGSYSPSIAVDSAGNIYVAWMDDTDGAWGSDIEIMYTKYSISNGGQPQGLEMLLLLELQQPASYTLIFIGIGAIVAIVIIVIVIKKKE